MILGSVNVKKLTCPIEWKASDPDSNVIEGFASVFDIVDEQGDLVHAGSFVKTVRERVPKGLVKLLDSHVPDGAHTLGTVIEAREVRSGPGGKPALWFKANLSSAPSAQDTRIKMIEGHLDRVSIGYLPTRDGERAEQTSDGQWIRHLTELKLYEISVVPVPANEAAVLTSVKAVVPFADLPLADRDRSWDADGAVARWRRASGSEDEPNARYRDAFVWFDRENADEFGSYKLPVADVVDGTLTAVPRAIFAAAAAIEGARGGVLIPDDDMDAVRAHLSRYYAKMRRAFDDDSLVPPWEQDSKSLRARQAELERALGIRRGGLSGPRPRPRDRSVAALDAELTALELDIAMMSMEGEGSS